MKRLPTQYPTDEFDGHSSYEVLGVKKTDSMEHINSVYKKLIRVLHPDKSLTFEAKKLGWTDDEKIEAFENVKKAYEYIKIEKNRKMINVPDYNINYDLDSDVRINPNPDLLAYYGQNQQAQQQVQGQYKPPPTQQFQQPHQVRVNQSVTRQYQPIQVPVNENPLYSSRNTPLNMPLQPVLLPTNNQMPSIPMPAAPTISSMNPVQPLHRQQTHQFTQNQQAQAPNQQVPNQPQLRQVPFRQVPIPSTGPVPTRQMQMNHNQNQGSINYNQNQAQAQAHQQNRQNVHMLNTMTENSKKNPEMFNKFFDIQKDKQERDGFADPTAIGYSSLFNTSEEDKQRERDAIKNGLTRGTIDVAVNPKLERAAMNPDGTIVRHNPLGKSSFNLVSNAIGFTELGLTKIDDFSVTVKGAKSSLGGSDLMAVYGSNNEYWEDSAMRDKELSDKYNDTTTIDKKLNNHLATRKDFDPKARDSDFTRQMQMEDERLEMQEAERAEAQRRNDTYFYQRSIGY